MKRFQQVFRIVLCLLVLFLNLCADQSSRRDKWMQPEKIMDAIGVIPGMVIGEAGAGEGYFTFKLAHRVGNAGRIYANDILERVLGTIRERCERQGITNITTVLGEVEDPLFPESTLDMVVMMAAFHDFEKQVEWLKNVKQYMKSNASLVIIEKDPGKMERGSSHHMTKDEILETVKQAGYKLVRVEMFLERDNIYIFRLQ